MSNVQQLLRAEFEAVKNEVIALYQQSGHKASGNWGATLEVQATPAGASLTAAGYLEGRKPGKQAPSAAIEKWLNTKGIAARAEKEISLSSLAYLIARKIGREGWQPEIKGSELIKQVLTPQRIQQIMDRAGAIYITDFTRDIINFLKQIAV